MDRIIYTSMTGANAAQHRQALLSNIVLTLALAALLHYLIENPSRRWGARLVRSRARSLDCRPC